MDHSELIAEMGYIEKLSTQERLKLARRRRMQQMKKWGQKEKEVISTKKDRNTLNESSKRRKKNGVVRGVAFASNVMILEAAARNDIDEVKALLEMGVNPDSTNEDGLTALHQCCIDDSEEMMRLLVLYGANVNAQDSEKWTPLHAAATCGHLHLARFLITNDANLLAVNADGNMPYDICEDDGTLDYIEGEMAARGVTQVLIDDTRAAVEKQMLSDLKTLKEDGKSLMYRDEHGATALHVAAANGYIHVVDYLLSQNIPTGVQDNDDWAPLHASACWGHPDVLELLVQHGANLQAKTKNQETPYDICEDAELRERISQLINEQETKRLHDQNRRIRRVRSNKRTQSIRRTSIRERTLTPKKEALEEGRMRVQLESQRYETEHSFLPDVCHTNGMGTNSPFIAQIDDNLCAESTPIVNGRGFHLLSDREEDGLQIKGVNSISGNIDKTSTSPNEDIKEICTFKETSFGEPQGDNAIKPLSLDLAQISNIPSPPLQISTIPSIESPSSTLTHSPTLQTPIPPPRSTSNSSTLIPTTPQSPPINNNKIDIHVTVTLNPFAPGTLADLKKQRALSRASQNSFTLSGGSSVFSLNATQDEMGNATVTTPSESGVSAIASPLQTPSSPQNPRRFCGEPSDSICRNDHWTCCVIM